jgi:hypothetical protein
MDTRVSTPYLLRRVAARAGIGVWRHRGGMLLAVVVCAAVGGYVALGSNLDGLLPSAAASGTVGRSSETVAASGDCADAAIAAIASKAPTAAQRAYQCMDSAFQQRVPEQTFVQQMQAQSLSNVDMVNRVGDYHSPAGGSMVYYAVDANGQSLGYIVYLGQNGKVLKIE